MNHGLIIVETPALDPRAYRFGGLSALPRQVLRPDRNYRQFLPKVEYQNIGGFDRMACVTYSAWNGLEILIKCKYDTVFNASDRFTAKLSGTTPSGNSFYNVAESIRKLHGGVVEEKWPDVTTSFSNYYSEVPAAIVSLGKELLPYWDIGYEFVWDDPDSLWDALQYGPLQVAVYAYGPEVNGIVQRVETQGNHAVTLVNAAYGQWWEIFDHYARDIRKLAWNTRFWGALRYDINKKAAPAPPMYQFKEDHMYFVAEGKGEEFAFIAGKLRHDDPNKMRRQIDYRLNGDTKGRFPTISLKELEGVEAFDLKGNSVGPAKDIAK